VAHENLQRTEHIEGSSDRSFGLVFAAVFLIVALLPLFSREPPRWWALAVSAAFAVIAFARPSLLAVPNKLWTRLGILLGRIVSPIALGILFYAVFSPFGILMRLFGKDPLRLRRDPAASTYWVNREPPGPLPGTLTNQF
jgi:hypothetical protein